ncbi:MAG: hypothetical protein ABFD16_24020 [Thermoguttaceae bacterium]|jgi:hypothetical protein
MLCRSAVGLAITLGILSVTDRVQASEPVKAQAPAGVKSWIFDQGEYSNSPKTGERVWQYSPTQPVYRDPNAVYDSPHGAYPFLPDVSDPYQLYRPAVIAIPGYYLPPVYGPLTPLLP